MDYSSILSARTLRTHDVPAQGFQQVALPQKVHVQTSQTHRHAAQLYLLAMLTRLDAPQLNYWVFA